jgi:hypothetical protein
MYNFVKFGNFEKKILAFGLLLISLVFLNFALKIIICLIVFIVATLSEIHNTTEAAINDYMIKSLQVCGTELS